MNDIEELKRVAGQIETKPLQAIEAMVKLARVYGNGREDVPANLLTALYWAEKAAYMDSHDGYLEITRIVGSACIASEDHKFKMEYASYAVGTCDLDTLRRFGRADIAFNVGSICEYMARYSYQRGAEQERSGFDRLAYDYYFAAVCLEGPACDLKIADAFTRTIARVERGATRPGFSAAAYAAEYKMH